MEKGRTHRWAAEARKQRRPTPWLRAVHCRWGRRRSTVLRARRTWPSTAPSRSYAPPLRGGGSSFSWESRKRRVRPGCLTGIGREEDRELFKWTHHAVLSSAYCSLTFSRKTFSRENQLDGKSIITQNYDQLLYSEISGDVFKSTPQIFYFSVLPLRFCFILIKSNNFYLSVMVCIRISTSSWMGLLRNCPIGSASLEWFITGREHLHHLCQELDQKGRWVKIDNETSRGVVLNPWTYLDWEGMRMLCVELLLYKRPSSNQDEQELDCFVCMHACSLSWSRAQVSWSI